MILAAYRKYNHLIILIGYMVLWAFILCWVPAGKLSIPVEVWDDVATIGWSLVPVGMVLVLVAFALNLREYRTRQAADADLVQAQADAVRLDTALRTSYQR